MAKADHTISDWIWLREALDLAVAVFGSEAGAKEYLTEWLAAGELPWDCTRWKALDAASLSELHQSHREALVFALTPSATYCRGAPQFWSASRLEVNWEDNSAREAVTKGAHAWGIKVSRAHLLVLLPEQSSERDKTQGASVWISAEAKRMKDSKEIPPDIRISEFARKLASRMKKAAHSDRSLRPIKSKSIENQLRNWGLWPIASIK